MKEKKFNRLMAVVLAIVLSLSIVFMPELSHLIGAEDATTETEATETEVAETEVGQENGIVGGLIQPVTDDPTEEMTTVEIAEASTPAVVAIMTLVQMQPVWGSPQTAMGSGSGVILTPDGYIVTNNHVVEGASDVRVRLASGEEFTAQIVARDARTDLAVVKIEANDLPFMTLTDSNQVKVGERAIAIGNPLGELEGTVTQGIVSGLNRTVSTRSDVYSPVNVIEGVIQTDAAINSGNSGGALVNSKGKLMGINVAKPQATSGNTTVEGIGFAIPSNIVADIVNQLLDQGYVSGRPYIGIMPVDVNRRMQYYYSMPAGAYVRTVIEGSAAEKAGVLVSDIITRLNGEAVNTASDLQQLINQYAAGDTVELEIWRAGIYQTLELTLDERSPRNLESDPTVVPEPQPIE